MCVNIVLSYENHYNYIDMGNNEEREKGKGGMGNNDMEEREE